MYDEAKADLRILFVDDDDFTRKLLSMAMSGYKNLFAKTGAEALDMYRNYRPDMVFLDIKLPDISGEELITMIHQINPAAYIVMLSANTYPDVVLGCIRKGARGFIAKPFSPAQFHEYIERYKGDKKSNDLFNDM